MAGHSKWANIKHKKGVNDTRRGKLGASWREASSYDAVRKALDAGKIPLQSSEITKIPGTRVMLDAETAQRDLKMIEAFEDNDDVQQVYDNMELTDELMAELK